MVGMTDTAGEVAEEAGEEDAEIEAVGAKACTKMSTSIVGAAEAGEGGMKMIMAAILAEVAEVVMVQALIAMMEDEAMVEVTNGTVPTVEVEVRATATMHHHLQHLYRQLLQLLLP